MTHDDDRGIDGSCGDPKPEPDPAPGQPSFEQVITAVANNAGWAVLGDERCRVWMTAPQLRAWMDQMTAVFGDEREVSNDPELADQILLRHRTPEAEVDADLVASWREDLGLSAQEPVERIPSA